MFSGHFKRLRIWTRKNRENIMETMTAKSAANARMNEAKNDFTVAAVAAIYGDADAGQKAEIALAPRAT